MPGWLIHQGAVDGPMFIEWIKNEVLTRMQPYPQPRSVLVMDNASIHRNEVCGVYKG
jgi:transposase